ncbi:sporulation initiation phosphotransferase B [Metabacillus fastidiosus]|uniref:sporulation initiation phosphotransferase B n=1 Tax=Metabacillus fastidiosus TaxID=1458 RepID=UPI002E1A72D6|nr:sporulation initiation phosphotransferase B [Metabacillus fastidiosus]
MTRKEKQWCAVNILSHSRHDWMNKLQLIKGNLALRKYDRVSAIIDEIVIEAQNESNLCNLKMPDLAALFMTCNWESHRFSLEYEVVGDIINLEHYDNQMTSLCTAFFDLLDQSAEQNYDNHLSILVEPDIEKDEIRFIFDFNGIITNTERLSLWLDRQKERQDKVFTTYELTTYELNVMVTLRHVKGV